MLVMLLDLTVFNVGFRDLNPTDPSCRTPSL